MVLNWCSATLSFKQISKVNFRAVEVDMLPELAFIKQQNSFARNSLDLLRLMLSRCSQALLDPS